MEENIEDTTLGLLEYFSLGDLVFLFVLPVAGEELLCDLNSDVTLLSSLVQIQQVRSKT